jgi:hypothetical protein
MTFEEILEQAMAMLQRHGRLTYRALKRQFDLDDAYLDDLKHEIIEGQRLAVDEDGKVLVWTGEAASVPATVPAPAQGRAPLAYILPHLTEKILTARAALEGERKQVTVLFADLKGSTELIASLDPEAARRLLDPALHLMMEAVHRYEGTVNQVLGNGIMALFGAPVAHEDHAARACYAALAMQAARQRKARGEEAFALHQLGTLHAHAALPDAALAEDHYRQALALADELGMRPLQAHCHRGLGTLYAKTGQQEQAHTELATAIDLYRAMDMTFWLPQTEATLVRAGGST